MDSFIYVIQTGEFVKVGYSERPEDRLRNLLGGTPYDCILHASFAVPAKLVFEIERYLHQQLSTHHHRGEWFRMEPQFAVRAIELLLEQLDEDPPRKENGAFYPYFSGEARKWRKRREWLNAEVARICRAKVTSVPGIESVMGVG